MNAYEPSRYGRVVGDRYDDYYPADAFDTDAAVAALSQLIAVRPARAFVEFGIGTGRLAIPLAQRGFQVAGIDASEAMVAQLRAKPGGEAIDVGLGDYRTTRVQGHFSVVALVFNNIFDPRGYAAQLDLFRNAAAHLEPGGCFVIEAFVLGEAQRSGDWFVSPRFVADDRVELQLGRYDVATNRLERTLVQVSSEGTEMFSVVDSYAAPGEIDVMAEVTGFRRQARWANWSGETFTATSSKHISVYEFDAA